MEICPDNMTEALPGTYSCLASSILCSELLQAGVLVFPPILPSYKLVFLGCRSSPVIAFYPLLCQYKVKHTFSPAPFSC